jgi:type I restriction enzyme, S subunit
VIATMEVATDTARKWQTTIGDLCDEFGGDIQTGPFGSQLHASDYSIEGTPVAMPRDLVDGRIVCDQIARVGSNHVDRLKQHMLQIGDIVFSRRGDITRFAVVTENEVGWLCGTGCIRIRLNCPSVDIGYARCYLEQEAVGKWLMHQAKGITMPNLNTKIIRELPFVYPPLAEQKRIAEILDAADALRAKRREALAQLDSLLQATFHDLFGDTVTNPKGWNQAPLGSLCDIGSSSRVFVEELVEEGVPFYRGTEVGAMGAGETIVPTLFITRKRYEELKQYAGVPQPGDLLLPSICPDGRIYIVRDKQPFYFKDGRVLWIKAAKSGINSIFLRYHLKLVFAADYNKIASGTTFAELKIFALKALVVHVPPPERQAHFARFVGTYEKQVDAHRAHLAELDTLFASLQHRAFRGEL